MSHEAARVAELEMRVEQLELLTNVATASNQAVTLEDALHVAVEGICQHLRSPLGHAYLVRDGTHMESSRVWHAEEPERFARFREASDAAVFAPGEGVPGRVFAEQRSVWIADVRAEETSVRGELLTDLPVSAAFGFPILAGSRTVGMIEVFSDAPREPDRAALALVGQIGIQLGRVVERMRSEDEMTDRAMHDGLTGLPNRQLFLDRLDLALVRASRRQRLTGVLFIDLDGFKAVNDGAGHAAGDLLLKETARRMTDRQRKEDTIARLGGDEFVVLCEDLRHEHEAMELAERLQRVLLRPFQIEGQEHLVTASIGIAVARPEETDAQLLMADADAAMYKAKNAGRARHELFSESMRDRVVDRMRLERALSRALDEDQLSLYYQPIVALDGKETQGTEALVRWEDPEHGLRQPSDFIPVAEESNLILRIGEWVLRQACGQAAEWRSQAGYGHLLPVSVNLASRQLADERLPTVVRDALDQAGLHASDLRLEVTESALVDNAEVPARTLVELRRLGVGVLLDDFGTGYSSLTHLQDYPVDVLKIDQSFVTDLGSRESASAVVRAIVGMGHSMGLTVVAEGIETDAQAAEAARLGCDSGQGYLFARPAPTALITAGRLTAN